MIYVTVEIQRGGYGKKERIGVMKIHNRADHPDRPKRGNYIVRLMKRGSFSEVVREGTVEDYPRESYNVWRLVFRALKSVLHEERPMSEREIEAAIHAMIASNVGISDALAEYIPSPEDGRVNEGARIAITRTLKVVQDMIHSSTRNIFPNHYDKVLKGIDRTRKLRIFKGTKQ